ncbi:Mor transcription activator family protein [Pandoraea apista]|uniref:Mor transcription activator family protein n=1 Tax=Pandoraea apista TaxID=93218 RepID=UPI0021ADAA25|nr:Mor transcription activator family protein [Pandoraea apista]
MDLSAVKDELPEFVKLLIRVVGMEATIKLIKRLGGTTLLVAKRRSRQGEASYELLAEVIGSEAADRMTAHFGGDLLYIPNCANAIRLLRDRSIRADFDGLTREHSAIAAVVKLAQRTGLSDRQIWRILKCGDVEAAAQCELF